MSSQPIAPSPSTPGSELATAPQQRPHRWEPASLFDDLQTDMARLLAGGPFGMWPLGRSLRRLTHLPTTGMPRVDVFERDGKLVVKAELPGVKKEDIELEIEGGDLVLRAERQEEREVKEENWYRMERSSGSLYRRLPLPEGVSTDQIQATLTDGVLEVTIPNIQKAEPAAQKITVG